MKNQIFALQTPRQSVREVANESSLQPSYCTETKWDNRAAFTSYAEAKAYAQGSFPQWRIRTIPTVGGLTTAVRHAEGVNF